MAVLGAADVALLDRARPGRIAQHTLGFDAQVSKHLPNASAVGVRADDARQRDTRSQRAQHHSYAAGAAEAFLPFLRAQENHRRFLTDALGVAPNITIEHEIADDEYPR